MEKTLHHHIAIAYSPNSSIEVDQTSLPPPPCLTLGPRWDQTQKALAPSKRLSKKMVLSRAWPRDHPTLNVGVTGGACWPHDNLCGGLWFHRLVVPSHAPRWCKVVSTNGPRQHGVALCKRGPGWVDFSRRVSNSAAANRLHQAEAVWGLKLFGAKLMSASGKLL